MLTPIFTTLQTPSLKLAAAMRTVGWFRRVAPELSGDGAKPAAVSTRSFDVSANHKPDDGALGSLFLVCRLHALYSMLEALEPLRDLADQESAQRTRQQPTNQSSQQTSFGTQSERYLKRYVEIFREQSFNIVSMYKSVFPQDMPGGQARDQNAADLLLPLPAPLASFILHLVEMLKNTLKEYLPSITDKSARESLLTQVLYCAGSLGRLGADFGMMIALLEEEMAENSSEDPAFAEEPEWAQVMKKHRVQAGRLEVLARGVGSGARKGSPGPLSPGATAAAG